MSVRLIVNDKDLKGSGGHGLVACKSWGILKI